MPADKLRELVGKHLAGAPLDEADLFGRLPLDGDNLFEFLEELASQLHVDLSGYDWIRYQHDQGELLVPRFWDRLRRGFGLTDRPEPDRSLTRVSLSHLTAVVRSGRWFDPR